MEGKTLEAKSIDFSRNRPYFHINDMKKHVSRKHTEYNKEYEFH